MKRIAAVLVCALIVSVFAISFTARPAHASGACAAGVVAAYASHSTGYGGYTVYLCYRYDQNRNWAELSGGTSPSHPVYGTLSVHNNVGKGESKTRYCSSNAYGNISCSTDTVNGLSPICDWSRFDDASDRTATETQAIC